MLLPVHRRAATALVLALLVLACPLALPANGNGDQKDKDFPDSKKVLEDAKAHEGFYNLWQKEERLFCAIPPSRFDQPFLCNFAIARGPGSGDLLGGTTLHENGWILVWKRVGKKKVHLVRRNTRIRADKGSPMERAVAISFTDSILAAVNVETIMPDKAVVVDISPIFLSDMVGLAGQFNRTFGGSYGFDASRSVWDKIKAFPKNVELRSRCTYAASANTIGNGSIPDRRSIQIVLHYSLSELPSTGYKPRLADDRVGYFEVAIKDFSNPAPEGPMVHYVTRWQLDKADDGAKLSPPVRPIVFHIEKSVPHRWRPYVREGILEWNAAFRKIGFADAIEVRVQGDHETWDPEDVRYNSIRWITSPYTFAIGPSRIDPRTGQILDADILVDASWIRYYRKEYEEIFGLGGGKEEGKPETENPTKALEACLSCGHGDGQGRRTCRFTRGLAHQFHLGVTAMQAAKGFDAAGLVPDEYIGKALKSTIMHEVGHTLGLRHNFKGSALRPLKELHDKALTEKEGLTASIMDYTALNLAPKGEKQGEFFESSVGIYDHWAIEYGYKPLKKADPKAELPELEKIARRCTERGLAYGTDEDAWSIHLRDLDPTCNQYDLGEEPMDWAEQRMAVIRDLFDGLVERVVEKGAPFRRARSAFTSLLYEYGNMLALVTKYVGGQTVSRAHRDDPQAPPPFVPVPAEKQRKALALLASAGFAAEPFRFPPELVNSLAPDWRDDWESDLWTQERLDYPLQNIVSRLQLRILARLCHPRVMGRILETEHRFAEPAKAFRLAELFSALTKGIWTELFDAKKGIVPIEGLRRDLQREHLRIMSLVALGRYGTPPEDARTLAALELRDLAKRIRELLARKGAPGDRLARAHLEESAARIDKVIDARVTGLEP